MAECCICESYRDSAFGCDGCGFEVCPDCRMETEVRVLCDECFGDELVLDAPDVRKAHDEALAWLNEHSQPRENNNPTPPE